MDSRIRFSFGALLFASLGVGACGPAEDRAPDEAAPAAAPAPAPLPSLPATNADAVWTHLQSEGYQTWSLWPGTTARYPGNEPHGMLLTTYVNAAALEASRMACSPRLR